MGTLPGQVRADINKQLYSRALQSIYGYSYDVIPDPDYAVSKDPDINEKLKRDPVIFHAMDQRCMAVASPEHYYAPDDEDNPNDKRVAQIFTSALRHVKKLSQSIYELAEAEFTGSEVQAVIGGRRRLKLKGTARVMDWWIPLKLVDIDRRRFRLAPKWIEDPVTKQKRLHVIHEIFSIAKGEYVALSKESLQWLIRLVWDDRESNAGYGRGMNQTLYPSFYVKGIAWELGLRGFERWAEGILVGTIDDDRAADVATSNEAVKTAFQTTLKEHKSDNVLVAGKGEKIEVVDSSGQGFQQFMAIMNYIDNNVTRVILRGVRPTGGATSGAFAQAETEAESMELSFRFTRRMVDEAIQCVLTPLMWTMNQANLAELGLSDAGMPWFTTADMPLPQSQPRQQPQSQPSQEVPFPS